MSRALFAILLTLPTIASGQGFALGPDPTEEWEGNLDYAATGATLLDCGAEGQCGGTGGANCRGLNSATVTFDVIPQTPTLRIAHAQVRWSASTPPGAGIDEQVTLVPPGGDPIAIDADADRTQSFQDAADGQSCEILGLLCGVGQCAVDFFSAGADVTAALNAHLDGGGDLNGEWTVRDVDIRGGDINDGQTAVQVAASLTIGAWSLFVVYEDEETLPLRRVYYYQGFELIGGQNRPVRPRGFLAPADPTVDITYLVLEGDAAIQGDSLRINGVEVSDRCNPNRNVFNSTISTGRADGVCQQNQFGVDLDSYTVRDAVEPGDEDAEIEFVVPRGDGLVTPGEQLFTDWLVIAFDHRLPSFDTVKPQKSSQPPSGSVVNAEDRIAYEIVVENTGGDFANNVVVRDDVPAGTTYIPTSAAVDGQAIGDGPEGASPFAGRGFNLSNHGNIGAFEPRERHVVTFAVTVDHGLEPGTVIQNVAGIVADELDEPATTEQVLHYVEERTDATVPPPPDMDRTPRPPRDMGPDGDPGSDPDVGGGRCPPHERLNIRGQCEPRPDSGADAELCPEADGPCGPGTTLQDGVCVSVCGGDLVWDQNCGRCGNCRQPTTDPCSKDVEGSGGGDPGCGCEHGGGGTGALLFALLLALPRRRRRE